MVPPPRLGQVLNYFRKATDAVQLPTINTPAAKIIDGTIWEDSSITLDSNVVLEIMMTNTFRLNQGPDFDGKLARYSIRFSLPDGSSVFEGPFVPNVSGTTSNSYSQDVHYITWRPTSPVTMDLYSEIFQISGPSHFEQLSVFVEYRVLWLPAAAGTNSTTTVGF